MADQVAEGLLSPWLRNRRLQAALPFIKGRVLDIGAGAGALAGFIERDRYLGVEIDEDSVLAARRQYPSHHFSQAVPEAVAPFDTVVALAVIEHVKDPVSFLRDLAGHLAKDPLASIVITTPHPAVDWVHGLGARLGLFSHHANEEHEELLDRKKLALAAQQAGLVMAHYQRFLWGANQLAVFRRAAV